VRLLIRKLLSGIVSKDQSKRLKRFEHTIQKRIASLVPALERDDLTQILSAELGVSRGDTIMVHAGLSLLNTTLSPAEIRDLVLEILGTEGTLVVPTFSPMAAVDYMRQSEPFDLQGSKSGMGSFAEAVRTAPQAVRSLHPTKSLAAIGPDAAALCVGHETCIYPFGRGSPFERLLERNSLIVGIGVPMSYLSFVHVAEDMHPDAVRNEVWEHQVLEKTCIDGKQAVSVPTRVHNMATMAKADPAKFCKRHVPTDQFAVFRRGGAPFFSIRAGELQQHILRGFREEFSIYD
jgi:aminoglycoside 3-N-acetyltransferase